MKSSSKMMFAVAVVALFAVAAIGVGYAYSGKTTNSDNNITSEYIKLSQADLGADFTNAVYWDSEQTNTDELTWQMDQTDLTTKGMLIPEVKTLTDGSTKVKLVKLGSAEMTISSTDRNPTAYTFKITPSGLGDIVGATQGKYVVGVKWTTGATGMKVEDSSYTPGTELFKELTYNLAQTYSVTGMPTSTAISDTITVTLYCQLVTPQTGDPASQPEGTHAVFTTSLSNAPTSFGNDVDLAFEAIVNVAA